MKNSFSDLTFQELVEKREQLRKEFMDFRISSVMGHAENPIERRTLRRNIAWLNTVIHEYALGLRNPGDK